MDIKLHIVSPEGVLVETEVSSVTLPGTLAPFQVLRDHAALLSSLAAGDIVYLTEAGEQRLAIRSGFVEVHDNQVDACVEV
ncbi:MAG: F0F1 ATP synthase subunit epsilon [Bacteroidales bacterium]|nr:F0F1 ATP synthase subunit epsilon [Bacteroidales bacterium]